MSSQIDTLHQQVTELYGCILAMRNPQSSYPLHPSLGQMDPPADYRSNMSPPQSRANHPQFQGPTSSAFNLDVAKSSLQTMGITPPEVQVESGPNDIDPALNALHQQQQAPVAAMVNSPHKDPLWQLSKDAAIKYCKIYDEEINMMYPMLNIEKMIAQAEMLFSLMEAALSTCLTQEDLPGAEKLGSSDLHILKMVLASGLMAEGHGESSLGRAIYESCRAAFECKLTSPVDIKGLVLMVIVVRSFAPDFSIEKCLEAS